MTNATVRFLFKSLLLLLWTIFMFTWFRWTWPVAPVSAAQAGWIVQALLIELFVGARCFTLEYWRSAG